MNTVAHIGGFELVNRALLRFQEGSGYKVQQLGKELLSGKFALTEQDLRELIETTPQIIHIHRPGALADGKLRTQVEDALLKLQESGSKIFFHYYGFCPRATFNSLTPDYTFFSDVEALDSTTLPPDSEWLSLPLDLADLPEAAVREPTRDDAKLLLVAWEGKSGPEAEALNNAIAKLKSRNIAVKLKVEVVKTEQELIKAIFNTDAVLEAIDKAAYGFVGSLALACGKTLFSGASKALHQIAPPLSFAPVLETNSENLEYRLESVWKEPRCMRDFGKRGRAFAAKFHQIQSSGAQVLQAYSRD